MTDCNVPNDVRAAAPTYPKRVDCLTADADDDMPAITIIARNERATRLIRQWLAWEDRPVLGTNDTAALESLLDDLDIETQACRANLVAVPALPVQDNGWGTPDVRAAATSAEPVAWAAIASYVETVARKAFLRGYSEAADDLGRALDRDIQAGAADAYVASGFDEETVKRFHPASPAPQVAALREEQDARVKELNEQVINHWRSWYALSGVLWPDKPQPYSGPMAMVAQVASLSAALEAAKRRAAQVEEDDLLVFLDDTLSSFEEIRFVKVYDGPIIERSEQSKDAITVYVDSPRSINEFGDTARPHETLSDALRDWYKRDARPARAALPSGDATR